MNAVYFTIFHNLAVSETFLKTLAKHINLNLFENGGENGRRRRVDA